MNENSNLHRSNGQPALPFVQEDKTTTTNKETGKKRETESHRDQIKWRSPGGRAVSDGKAVPLLPGGRAVLDGRSTAPAPPCRLMRSNCLPNCPVGIVCVLPPCASVCTPVRRRLRTALVGLWRAPSLGRFPLGRLAARGTSPCSPVPRLGLGCETRSPDAAGPTNTSAAFCLRLQAST